MQVKMEMYLEIDDKDLELIRKLTHHIDWLLDLDSFPEIKSVEQVAIMEPSMSPSEDAILSYLEYSYAGAKAMGEFNTMRRIDNAILAFID